MVYQCAIANISKGVYISQLFGVQNWYLVVILTVSFSHLLIGIG